MDKRKPEWAPQDAGAAFASSVVKGTDPSPVSIIKSNTKHSKRVVDIDSLEKGIIEGDITSLSKAITLIESNSEKHFEPAQELLKRLLPRSGKSIRIGITGVPGAGKSSFIERFGLHLISLGKKVSVLAIDPSSSISKGSILGDKTRMEELSRNSASFIRPSPAAGVLGGVARKTRETILLCEAAGFDVVLIETVGVGQSEITVRSIVDFFLLMQIAGAGDELQGIKKGIMELADLVVVNKADGDNIQRTEIAKQELNNALHYTRNATELWKTKAVSCSALTGTGISEVWEIIDNFKQQTTDSGAFQSRRTQQVCQWFESLLSEAVLHSFYSNPEIKTKLPVLRKKIEEGNIPVAYAVSVLLKS